jgi:cell division protein FtsI (penicillin-binding protein 3)
MAMDIGTEHQQEFLRKLGLLDPSPIELSEAAAVHPILPKNWSELSTMTIAYGHGLSVSPLQLAAAYATVVGDGRKVTPTLLRQGARPKGERIISEHTVKDVRMLLRAVVTDGTASLAQIPGYAVGGKTGTADKPDPIHGGYFQNKVISTFASVFPAMKPKYVLVVMLDEPVETSGLEPRHTAGWTAVPVAAEIISRIAPLLGLRPTVEGGGQTAVSVARN